MQIFQEFLSFVKSASLPYTFPSGVVLNSKDDGEVLLTYIKLYYTPEPGSTLDTFDDAIKESMKEESDGEWTLGDQEISIHEPSMRHYLMTLGFGGIRSDGVTQEMIDAILLYAYVRYWQHRHLIGDKSHVGWFPYLKSELDLSVVDEAIPRHRDQVQDLVSMMNVMKIRVPDKITNLPPMAFKAPPNANYVWNASSTLIFDTRSNIKRNSVVIIPIVLYNQQPFNLKVVNNGPSQQGERVHLMVGETLVKLSSDTMNPVYEVSIISVTFSERGTEVLKNRKLQGANTSRDISIVAENMDLKTLFMSIRLTN